MTQQFKKCSTCGEDIPSEELKCPYCGAVNAKGENGKKLKIVYEPLWDTIRRAFRPWVDLLVSCGIMILIGSLLLWLFEPGFIAFLVGGIGFLMLITGISSYFM